MATARPPANALPPAGPALLRLLGILVRIGIMAAAAALLLLAWFQGAECRRSQTILSAETLKAERMEAELADWRQRAAYASSPAFLDAAIKEFTLTRDANELEVFVEASPVPPVGDIR